MTRVKGGRGRRVRGGGATIDHRGREPRGHDHIQEGHAAVTAGRGGE